MTYSIDLKKVSSSTSLSVTQCLSHNVLIKNRALNKIVCCMLTNFDATLVFSTCSKYKEGKETVSLNINISRNKNSLCKPKNTSGKTVLGGLRDVLCPRSDG